MAPFFRGAVAALALIAAADTALAAPGQSARMAAPAPVDKQRLIVLTDIGGEPDDSQSVVRLLVYANQIDIEGLIATTSVWMKTSTHPEAITRAVEAYDKSRAQLLMHEPGFPETSRLKAVVATGQPGYGMSAVAPGRDSEGAKIILRALASPDPRPLWVTAWGGVNTLAQALLTLKATASPAELARQIAKLRVYTISDQDDAGSWLRKTFPSLFYVVSTGGYGNATWTAINTVVPGIDNNTISNAWIARNIQQGHGPLGAVYPDVGWGMEGDTPSFLGLIPNGLNTPDHPDWGGWGGRYALSVPAVDTSAQVEGGIPILTETRPIWTNTDDSFSPDARPEYGRATRLAAPHFKDFRVTLWRWRDEFQNDFAARMDWLAKPYDKANHPPIPVLDVAERITVHSGQTFGLSANCSFDPDGDSLSYLWFHYPEAGSWHQPIPAEGAENVSHVDFKAPVVSQLETAHFILKVTDKGSPALTRYKRVIVTILP